MEATSKPTRSETSLEQRQEMVRLHREGWSYRAIARQLAVSYWTVRRWVRRARQEGEAALAYRSRRPHTPHPQTTPAWVVERIRAIRQAHPNWGARLIRHQLLLEGVQPVPSEVTIHAWLRRLGFGRLRPRRTKALGWTQPLAAEQQLVWQLDYKQKGGSGI